MKLIEAIAHIEGFYAPLGADGEPNRPQRNNNPGNLDFESWMVEKYRAKLEECTPHPRFAHFPSISIGFQALHDLLAGPHYSNLTVEQAINRYAPPSENNTTNYIEFVCHNVGCQPTDLVSQVLSQG
jgi:hypothetical protein